MTKAVGAPAHRRDRRRLARLLEANGYPFVLEAAMKADAIRVLVGREEMILVVVTALDLPGTTAVGLIRDLTGSITRHVGFIVVTGQSSEKAAIDFANSGSRFVVPSAYFRKPLDREPFLSRLDDVMDQIRRKRLAHERALGVADWPGDLSRRQRLAVWMMNHPPARAPVASQEPWPTSVRPWLRALFQGTAGLVGLWLLITGVRVLIERVNQ
jgi:CheY-like chemotaxis protein